MRRVNPPVGPSSWLVWLTALGSTATGIVQAVSENQAPFTGHNKAAILTGVLLIALSNVMRSLQARGAGELEPTLDQELASPPVYAAPETARTPDAPPGA